MPSTTTVGLEQMTKEMFGWLRGRAALEDYLKKLKDSVPNVESRLRSIETTEWSDTGLVTFHQDPERGRLFCVRGQSRPLSTLRRTCEEERALAAGRAARPRHRLDWFQRRGGTRPPTNQP